MPKSNFTRKSIDTAVPDRGEPYISPDGIVGTSYGPGSVVDVGCPTCTPLLHLIPNNAGGPVAMYAVRQHEPTCSARAELRENGRVK